MILSRLNARCLLPRRSQRDCSNTQSNPGHYLPRTSACVGRAVGADRAITLRSIRRQGPHVVIANKRLDIPEFCLAVQVEHYLVVIIRGENRKRIEESKNFNH